MIQFAKLLIFVSFMTSIAVGNDAESTDPISVLGRMNAQLLEQIKKLDIRIEECDAIVRQVQAGLPFQIGQESQPYQKVPLPFCELFEGPKPEAPEFGPEPSHFEYEKIFPNPVDDLPNVTRRVC
jgi:hypothetical protein